MSTPTIYRHPIEEHQHVLSALHQHLPTSIPLYRRLQFQNFTPSSRLLCSLSPEALSAEPQQTSAATRKDPWLAAYVDRSRRPETEVWFFGSWECSSSSSGAVDDWRPRAAALMRALLVELRACPIDDGEAASRAGGATAAAAAAVLARGAYESHLANPNIVLFGTLHQRSRDILMELGVLSKEFVGADLPYWKYIFDLSNTTARDLTLPSGLRWGKLLPQYFALVKSRTQIPRQDRTLRMLPSLAIYPDEDGVDPIAWSFLGPDGSLSSLHVEPEYRGKGLAKMLASKLFAEGMEVNDGKDDSWAHADVATDNTASNGVCKGLGGVSSYHVYWVRADVSDTGNTAEALS